MNSAEWTEKAALYLHKLCDLSPDRRVGSPGNRAATDLFAGVARSFGFDVETPRFDCIDWMEEGVRLVAGKARFEAFASPYSLGCHICAPLSLVSSVEELAAATVDDSILLLRDDIAREQLMPKNFPFYNPEGHQRIIETLEAKQPRAIVAATSRDMGMVGGLDPFPLFEDVHR